MYFMLSCDRLKNLGLRTPYLNSHETRTVIWPWESSDIIPNTRTEFLSHLLQSITASFSFVPRFKAGTVQRDYSGFPKCQAKALARVQWINSGSSSHLGRSPNGQALVLSARYALCTFWVTLQMVSMPCRPCKWVIIQGLGMLLQGHNLAWTCCAARCLLDRFQDIVPSHHLSSI